MIKGVGTQSGVSQGLVYNQKTNAILIYQPSHEIYIYPFCGIGCKSCDEPPISESEDSICKSCLDGTKR